MYPYAFFSLWNPENAHTLRLFYGKTEKEIYACIDDYRKRHTTGEEGVPTKNRAKDQTKDVTTLLNTTFRCSCCAQDKKLVPDKYRRRYSSYLEMVIIACNPKKYLLPQDLIVCGDCIRMRAPFTPSPEPNYKLNLSKSRPFSIDLRKRPFQCCMGEGHHSDNHAVINVSPYIVPPQIKGYYFFISNYYGDKTDAKARSEAIPRLHPRYQIDLSLFDMLYLRFYYELASFLTSQ